jgi:hypothetical protein
MSPSMQEKERSIVRQVSGCVDFQEKQLIPTVKWISQSLFMTRKEEGTENLGVVLGDMQANKMFNFNLFSVTKMLLKGYKLKGDRYSLTLWNQTQTIVFDIVVHTQNRALFCAKIIRKLSNDTEMANLVTKGEEDNSKVAKKILKVNIKCAHQCLGHLSENMTCKIVAQLGMVLSRTAFSTCKACVIRKSK